MDTLDYISELRGCIRNSSSTLNTLKMSFSEKLASKSRKPPPEIHSDDDSEVEDEFGQVIPLGPPPPGMPPSNSLDGPTKTLKAQEEKKKQEEVLQKIFGVPLARKPKPVKSEPVAEEKETETETEQAKMKARSDEDPRTRFVKNLGPVAKKLMKFFNPSSDQAPDAKKILEMIEHAARLYTESAVPIQGPSLMGEGSSSKGSPSTSTSDVTGEVSDDVVIDGGAAKEPGLFDEPPKSEKIIQTDPAVSNPEDIDIEEPEGGGLLSELDAATAEEEESDLQVETQGDIPNGVLGEVVNEVEVKPQEVDGEVPVPTTGLLSAQDIPAAIRTRQQLIIQAATLRASHTQIQQEGDLLKRKMNELKEKMLSSQPTNTDYQTLAHTEAEFQKVSDRVSQLSRNMEELEEQVDEAGADTRSLTNAAVPKVFGGDKMGEYVRSTRGLGIRTLAIYLIPIKANILSRSIELSVLRDITLLNVGNQTGFWNLLAKENAINPLPLCKIYTDNVTLPFLGLVAQLENLTHLLMAERQKGGRPESTASKTTVKIEQIRRALKKHIGILKVLLIKHDSSSDWDLDVKTVMMLCSRATQIEELSVTFNAKTMVCFPLFH